MNHTTLSKALWLRVSYHFGMYRTCGIRHYPVRLAGEHRSMMIGAIASMHIDLLCSCGNPNKNILTKYYLRSGSTLHSCKLTGARCAQSASLVTWKESPLSHTTFISTSSTIKWLYVPAYRTRLLRCCEGARDVISLTGHIVRSSSYSTVRFSSVGSAAIHTGPAFNATSSPATS